MTSPATSPATSTPAADPLLVQGALAALPGVALAALSLAGAGPLAVGVAAVQLVLVLGSWPCWTRRLRAASS